MRVFSFVRGKATCSLIARLPMCWIRACRVSLLRRWAGSIIIERAKLESCLQALPATAAGTLTEHSVFPRGTNMNPKLFGTDGIRGVANADLTPEIAFQLGRAVRETLSDEDRPTFVVGRDTRQSGPMLEAALVAGMTSAGADVLLCGIIPTPAVAYLIREFDASGGIVISASHNPPEFNGLKVFGRNGRKLSDELEEALEERLVTNDTKHRPIGADIGNVSTIEDAEERYVEYAAAFFKPGIFEGLRIAIDCGHGAAYASTPDTFRRLGAEVTAINTDFDGMDINVGCGSTNLAFLQEMMSTGNFHIGIAHDGDADRMLAVDELGNEVDGDQIMAICGLALKQEGALANDTIISTVMCNLGFELAMKAQGIHVIKTKVGDRYVLEQMEAMEATLGGEQSGHIIFLEYNTTGDGLFTALQLARAMTTSGKPLSELSKVMTKYPQVMKNVHVPKKDYLEINSRIQNAIAEADARLGDTGRVLVRASGTEPLVRVMVEADSVDTAEQVVEALALIVEQELS